MKIRKKTTVWKNSWKYKKPRKTYSAGQVGVGVDVGSRHIVLLGKALNFVDKSNNGLEFLVSLTLNFGSNWIKLDQIGSIIIKLDQIGSIIIKLDQTGLKWIKMDQFETIWYRLDQSGSIWINLVQIGKSGSISIDWINLNRAGSNWIKLD